MKIGMVIYSHSGHTLTVAQALKEALLAAGHEVQLERLEIVGEVSLSETNVDLHSIPDVAEYDVVILGTPVRGGLPSPAMVRYLEQVPNLEGKTIVGLFTHFFRSDWGVKQATEKLKEMCASKGATLGTVGDVRWPSLGRKRKINEVVDTLSQLF
ncbi:MAG: NAD(P)H-dependent oxidoreductase [Anaerolineae bacterium]|nr:NAD(P)H-dependent oxidoreductase [Anaerolineae bacterium]